MEQTKLPPLQICVEPMWLWAQDPAADPSFMADLVRDLGACWMNLWIWERNIFSMGGTPYSLNQSVVAYYRKLIDRAQELNIEIVGKLNQYVVPGNVDPDGWGGMPERFSAKQTELLNARRIVVDKLVRLFPEIRFWQLGNEVQYEAVEYPASPGNWWEKTHWHWSVAAGLIVDEVQAVSEAMLSADCNLVLMSPAIESPEPNRFTQFPFTTSRNFVEAIYDEIDNKDLLWQDLWQYLTVNAYPHHSWYAKPPTEADYVEHWRSILEVSPAPAWPSEQGYDAENHLGGDHELAVQNTLEMARLTKVLGWPVFSKFLLHDVGPHTGFGIYRRDGTPDVMARAIKLAWAGVDESEPPPHQEDKVLKAFLETIYPVFDEYRVPRPSVEEGEQYYQFGTRMDRFSRKLKKVVTTFKPYEVT